MKYLIISGLLAGAILSSCINSQPQSTNELEYLKDYRIGEVRLWDDNMMLSPNFIKHITQADIIIGPYKAPESLVRVISKDGRDTVDIIIINKGPIFHIAHHYYKAKDSLLVPRPIADTLVTEERPLLQIKQNGILDSIIQHYSGNDITSGRTNKPPFFNNCIIDSNKLFGAYYIADTRTKLHIPVIASAIVYFEKGPWRSDDNEQVVILVKVMDSLFKVNLTGFKVGDKTPEESHTLVKARTIDDITYYRQGNTNSVAVKSKEGIIISYLFWVCPFMMEDIEQIHPTVSDYLY